ncbi:hypothetical protein HZB96_03505 [Candidatus Gottesmanbacteria bacterium]|nr:hypothetical protein [Candidatus Gottesmanbacteria bacterium]
MTGDEVLAIFKKTGGYITGSHIVYTSGKHGEVYLNKDAIYPHTKEISAICLEIAKKFKDKGIEVVSAPALGGIILSQWTAYHLSLLTNREVLGVYTENVRKAKGQVVAVCVLVNRDSDNINSKTIGALFYPLAEVKMQAWEEKDCPLCQKNVPINTTVGKGREYLEKKKLED